MYRPEFTANSMYENVAKAFNLPRNEFKILIEDADKKMIDVLDGDESL